MITAILHTPGGDTTIRHTTGYLEAGPIYIDAPDKHTEQEVRRWARTATGMWGHLMGGPDDVYQYQLDAALLDNYNPYMKEWGPEITVTGRVPLPPEYTYIPPGAVG